MDFILGAISATAFFFVAAYIVRYATIRNKPISLRASQSRTHAMISPIAIFVNPIKEIDTQATRHFDGSQVRVLMTETKAYWISNNALQVADIVDGSVVEESAKTLDIMTMDKVELNEIVFIVEKLTEGKSNDSWRSRD
jgi:type II secretory pathway component GspD/PulD (secretin)